MAVHKFNPFAQGSGVRHGEACQICGNNGKNVGYKTNKAVVDSVVLYKKFPKLHRPIILYFSVFLECLPAARITVWA